MLPDGLIVYLSRIQVMSGRPLQTILYGDYFFVPYKFGFIFLPDINFQRTNALAFRIKGFLFFHKYLWITALLTTHPD